MIPRTHLMVCCQPFRGLHFSLEPLSNICGGLASPIRGRSRSLSANNVASTRGIDSSNSTKIILRHDPLRIIPDGSEFRTPAKERKVVGLLMRTLDASEDAREESLLTEVSSAAKIDHRTCQPSSISTICYAKARAWVFERVCGWDPSFRIIQFINQTMHRPAR